MGKSILNPIDYAQKRRFCFLIGKKQFDKQTQGRINLFYCKSNIFFQSIFRKDTLKTVSEKRPFEHRHQLIAEE